MLRHVVPLPLVGLALALTACSATQSPAPTRGTATPTSTTTAAAFCQVDLPPAWRSALSAGTLVAPPGTSQDVIGSSEDGTSLLVQATKNGTRTLEWVRSGSRTTVMAVTDPANDSFLDGAFDGRWAVFAVSHSPQTIGTGNLFAWDSQTGGPPRKLADQAAAYGSTGPLVHRGMAAWVDSGRVHLFNLANGTDRVMPDTMATSLFFTDSWLVWVNGSDHPSLRFSAVDAITGVPVTLPPALSSAMSQRYANGGGQTVVWTQWGDDQGGDTLMGWRPGWAGPRALVTVTRTRFEWPYVGGDLVSFGNGAYFVADLRSGSYAQVTPDAGYIRVVGDALVVEYFSGDKTVTGSTSVVHASQLPPLPKCS
jgi:hypothetical protein